MSSSTLYNSFLNRTVDGMAPSVQVMTVTPSMAAEWLASSQFEHQRSKRQWHIDYLAQEMKKGRFLPGTQIRFSVYDGQYRIIDGQHRLSAVIKSGIPQMFSVLWMPEDPSISYGHLDIGVGRTVQDMYSAIQLSEETGIGKDLLSRVGSAVKFIDGNFVAAKSKSDKLSPDEQANLIRSYSKAANNFAEVTAGVPAEMKSGISRVATLSIALVTFRFAAESLGTDKVEEFWIGVAFDDGLSIGDPRKTANRHILTTSMVGGSTAHSSSSKTMWSASYSARYLANCWNAWVEGREIKLTRVANDKSKMLLLGTPFDGK